MCDKCCYPGGNEFLQVLWKWTAKKRRDLLTPLLGKECSRNDASWGSGSPNERLSNTQVPRQTAITVGVYIGELTPQAWVVFFFCWIVSLMSKVGMNHAEAWLDFAEKRLALPGSAQQSIGAFPAQQSIAHLMESSLTLTFLTLLLPTAVSLAQL